MTNSLATIVGPLVKLKMYRLSVSILFIAALGSFWTFSRFTTDDAFIGWRYGKNLIDAGIWNYNPAYLDMTQAYTSPIYAVLSIFPNYFGWDVVLFFKIIAILTLIFFILWFLHKTRNDLLMLMLFLCLPATMVHAFSGLETFLFVILLGELMISLYEYRKWHSVFLILALFFTRPEAWLLVILVPVYFLIDEPIRKWKPSNLNWRTGGLIFISLAVPLGAYFAFNIYYFGSALPNSFYVKSAPIIIDPINFLKFLFFIVPLLILAFLNRIKLFLLLLTLMGAIIINYSTSILMQDFFSRFSFHIFAPVYIFLVYISAKRNENIIYMAKLLVTKESDFNTYTAMSEGVVIRSLLFMFLVVFAFQSTTTNAIGEYATQYPRALDSAAALGKALRRISKEENIKSFSYADAGMAAYHSSLLALDPAGLGSSEVSRHGMNSQRLNRYEIDFIVLHGYLSTGIWLEAYHQEETLDWANKNNFKKICLMHGSRGVAYTIYAKRFIQEIINVCESSQSKNSIGNLAYLKNTLAFAPWTYWKE